MSLWIEAGAATTPTTLAWLTDIHLAHLPEGGARAFGEKVRRDNPTLTMALVTGDIAEGPSWCSLLHELQAGIGVPVKFVLGNHDFSHRSVREVRAEAARLHDHRGPVAWLTRSYSVPLDQRTILTGHDGWYDCREGVLTSRSILTPDATTIKGFEALSPPQFQAAARSLADRFAIEARILLLDKFKAPLPSLGLPRIVFATHVPPYKEASWHEDELSSDDWLPWMCSRAMGDMLDDMSSLVPEVKFAVLCGHTHSPGVYRRSPNLVVRTGEAVYGAPRVSGVFTFDGSDKEPFP